MAMILISTARSKEASASDMGRSYSGPVRTTYNRVTVVQINFALPARKGAPGLDPVKALGYQKPLYGRKPTKYKRN